MMKKGTTALSGLQETAERNERSTMKKFKHTISKKISLLLVIALMGSTALLAQRQSPRRPMQKEQPTPEEIIQKKVERMTEKLNLTEAQSAEIKALMEKHQKIMEEENKAFREMVKQHREKMKESKESLSEGIKSSLNEEQLKALEEMQEHANRRFRRAPRERFQRPDAGPKNHHPRDPRPLPENIDE